MEESSQTESIGTGDHVVKQGECISSIAIDRGLFWETIWNEPANAELKQTRGTPNVLQPGDRVTVPELRPKQVSGAAGAGHRFLRRGVPVQLRLRLLDGDGQARAGVAFQLEIDGRWQNGTTDAEGRLEAWITGKGQSGQLVVGEDAAGETYQLSLGAVDPVTTPAGVQARLANLGFDTGPVDGDLGPKSTECLRRFQHDQGLDETGECDAATLDALTDGFGR